MSKEVGIINDFQVVAMETKFMGSQDKPNSFLVVLKTNFDVFVIGATEDTAMVRSQNLFIDHPDMTAWQTFPTEEIANAMQEELHTLDRSLPLERCGIPKSDTNEVHAPLLSSPPMGSPQAKSPPASSTTVNRGDSLLSPGLNSQTSNHSSPGKIAAISSEAARGATVIDFDKCVVNFDKKGKMRPTQKGSKVSVSMMFPRKLYPESIAAMTISQIGDGTMWHFQKECMQPHLDAVTKQFEANGEPIPLFVTSMCDMPLPDPKNAAVYRRNKKRYTVNKVMCFVRIPRGMGSIDSYVTAVWQSLHNIFKAGNNIGLRYANWLQEDKEVVYNIETGQSSRKKNQTHEQLARTFEKKLIDAFSNRSTEFNVPLDKMMSYGHIKEFFTEHCGYDGWQDLPVDLKKGVLHKWNRGQDYPDWDSTRIRSYNAADDSDEE